VRRDETIATAFEVDEEQTATQSITDPQQIVLIYLGGLPHIIVGTQQIGEYLMEFTHIVSFGHGSVCDDTQCSAVVTALRNSLSMVRHPLARNVAGVRMATDE